MDSSADIVAGIIDDNDLEAFAFLDEVTRSPTTQLIQEPAETNSSLERPIVLSQEQKTNCLEQKNTSFELPIVVSQGKETFLQKENVTLLAQSVMQALALMQKSKSDTILIPETQNSSNSDTMESGESYSDSDDIHLHLSRSVLERVGLQSRCLFQTENDEYQFQSTRFNKGADSFMAEVDDTKSIGQNPKNKNNPYTSVRDHSRFYELEIDSQNVKSLKKNKKMDSLGKKHKRKRNKSPNLTSEYTSMFDPHFEFSDISVLNNIGKQITPTLSDDSNISAFSLSSVKTVKQCEIPKIHNIDMKQSLSPLNSLTNLSSHLQSWDSACLEPRLQLIPPLLGKIKKKKKKVKKSKKNPTPEVPAVDSIEQESSLTSPDSLKSRRGSRFLAVKCLELSSSSSASIDSSCDSLSPLRASCTRRRGRNTRLQVEHSKSPHTQRHVSASPSNKKKRNVKKLKKKYGEAKDKKHKIKCRSKLNLKKSQSAASENEMRSQSSLSVLSLGPIREMSRSRSRSVVTESHTEQTRKLSTSSGGSLGRISETDIPLRLHNQPGSHPCSNMSNRSRGSFREIIVSSSVSLSCPSSHSRKSPRLKRKISNASCESSREMVKSNSQTGPLPMLMSRSSEPVKELASLLPLKISCRSNKKTRELSESISLSRSVVTSSLKSKNPSPRVIQEMSTSIATSKSVRSLLLSTENLLSGIDQERDKTTLNSLSIEPVASSPISKSKVGQISNKRPSVKLIEAISKLPAKASRSRSLLSRSRLSRSWSRSPRSRSRSSRSRSRSLRSRSRSKSKRRRISSKSKKSSSPSLKRHTRSRSQSRRSHSRNSFDWIYKRSRARGIKSSSRSPVVSSTSPCYRSRGRRTRSRSQSIRKCMRRPKSRSSKKRLRSSSWRRQSRERRSLSSRSLTPRSRRLNRRPRSMSSKRSLSPVNSKNLRERNSLRDLLTSTCARLTLAREQNWNDATTVGTALARLVPASAEYNQTRNDGSYFAQSLNMIPYAFQSVPYSGQQNYQPYHDNIAPSHENRAQTYHQDTETFRRLCFNRPPPGSGHLALTNSVSSPNSLEPSGTGFLASLPVPVPPPNSFEPLGSNFVGLLQNPVPPPNSFKPLGSNFVGLLPNPVPPPNSFKPPGSNFLDSLPNPVPSPTRYVPPADFRLTKPIPVPPPTKYKAPSSKFRAWISYPATTPISCNILLTGSPHVTPKKKQTEAVNEGGNITKNGLELCGGLADTALVGKLVSAPKPCNTTVGISVAPNENEAPQSLEDDFVGRPSVLVGKKPVCKRIKINLLSKKKKLVAVDDKQVDSSLMDITANGNKANAELDTTEKCNELSLGRGNLIACKTSEATESQFVHTEADKPTLCLNNLINSPQEFVDLDPNSSVEINVNNNLTTPRDILARLRNVVLCQKRSVLTQVDFLNMDLRGSVEVFNAPESVEHLTLFDALRDALK